MVMVNAEWVVVLYDRDGDWDLIKTFESEEAAHTYIEDELACAFDEYGIVFQPVKGD